MENGRVILPGWAYRRLPGQSPIGLYRWDIECLEDVISLALKDPVAYPERSTPGYNALYNFYERIRRLCGEAFDEVNFPDKTIFH